MSPTSNNLSVAQLEKLLDQKKSKLDNLTKQRDSLHKKLERVESQITSLEGKKTTAVRGRRRRKRPKNEKPLLEVVNDVLRRSKNGYPLAVLADKVRATGYKSNSADFKNVLYQSLYKSKDVVHDEETGRYRLK